MRSSERGVDAFDLGGCERLLHSADRDHLLQTKEQRVGLCVVFRAHNHFTQTLHSEWCTVGKRKTNDENGDEE